MGTDSNQIIDLSEWYYATQAAERLTANSGKTVDPSYVRTLAKYGKIRTYEISPRVKLYNKVDIDGYVVEDRGDKSARAKRLKALESRKRKKRVA